MKGRIAIAACVAALACFGVSQIASGAWIHAKAILAQHLIASAWAQARYRVREVTIVDQGETRVLESADSPQLTLITCFPFDAVRPGTRLRYVVIAERVA